MAIDEALLESVKSGGRPVLRLYRWDPPCLSLGRNQPGRGRYDRAEAARRGVDIVRRPTGGLAVYHDRELTYAVVASVTALGRPRAAYGAVNGALVAGLRRLGVAAQVAGGDPVTAPARLTTMPCFDAPAPGEVVAAGRKLVGSAQRCEARTLLQHGSVLMSGSQSMVDILGPGSARGPRQGWVTVEELVAAPTFDALAEAIRAGFEETLGIRLRVDGLTGAEESLAERLAVRHGSDDWVWRR